MTDIGKTGIIPFRLYGGYNKSPGSSFLRADGLVDNVEDFHIWRHGHQYDNLIFQKAYWKEMLEKFRGPKVLDLSDPDWITGGVNINEIGNLADAITCSSESLTNLAKKMFSFKTVIHVPDRLNFREFPAPRPHHFGRAKHIVWFGYIHNAIETFPAIVPAIAKHNLRLTIIANRDFEKREILTGINYQFVRYETQLAYALIKQADIVINPKSNRGLYKFKSNNKSIISWKLGVPVAENGRELELLLDPHERNIQVAQQAQVVESEYNIIQSAEQYRDIIRNIRNKPSFI